LRLEEISARGVQWLGALAERQRAGGQLPIGFYPTAVGRQDDLLGDGGAGDGLLVLGRAGAQCQGGEAGEEQLGTEHVGS